MKPSEIPMPEKLSEAETDERGYPIFFTVGRKGGSPNFRTIDDEKRYECARRDLCGICGTRLEDERVFIGGTSEFVSMLFTEAPAHEECARYAATVCPYLSTSTMKPSEGVRARRIGLYLTEVSRAIRVGGGWKFLAGDPKGVEWIA